MDVNKLKVLIKAIESTTFSDAGEQMGFTQAGVSYIIKSLESEMGVQLLIRGKQGVRLTPAGAELLPEIKAVVAAEDALMQKTEGVKFAGGGKLRIGTLNSLSLLWLPPIIERFRGDYPDVQVDLQEAGTMRLEAMLAAGEVDFAFCSRSERGMEWIPLARDRMLAIMHKEHRFANEARIPLQILAKEPFIMPAPGFDSDVDRVLSAGRVRPNVIFTSMDDHTIVSMVQHGIGVSVVPELILIAASADLAVKELAPCEYRNLGVAAPSAEAMSPAARAFIAYAREVVPTLKSRIL